MTCEVMTAEVDETCAIKHQPSDYREESTWWEALGDTHGGPKLAKLGHRER